jgi:hypothetical protein
MVISCFCLSLDLSTYLCFFWHINIKLFEILARNNCGFTLYLLHCNAVFCIIGLGGDILKSRFDRVCAVWTWGNYRNMLATFLTKMLNLIDWLYALVAVLLCGGTMWALCRPTWSLKCLLSILPLPSIAAIFCSGSLLLTYINWV